METRSLSGKLFRGMFKIRVMKLRGEGNFSLWVHFTLPENLAIIYACGKRSGKGIGKLCFSFFYKIQMEWKPLFVISFRDLI